MGSLRIISLPLVLWLAFLHKLSIPPSLLSPTKLKWSVSVWLRVFFFTLIEIVFIFSTVSCYVQNAEHSLCSSLFIYARWDCRREKSSQSQLVLFLVPLGPLVSAPAVFSVSVKGAGPTRVRTSWERSVRINWTPASQSDLSSRGKSASLP